ncbi:MAG: hypothetical protein JOS17DRAFT_793831 [Linnemannia elongata]|nr:MAG: hypothetical protein JOS17DRAFT_793831 [Linnemannia elongata]
MSSKRSFQQIQQHQQQQEEPWLRYPSSLSTTKDFSRSGNTSSTPPTTSSIRQKHFSMGAFGDFQLRSITPSPTPPQQQQQQQQQQQPSQQPSSTTFIPEIKHRRSLARLSAPSASLQYGVGSDSYGYSSYRSSRSRRRDPPPKPLSEELSMALQNSEDNFSTPDTPPGLLSSPADISTPSSAASSSSTSTTHFPLFKPSTPSSQSTGKLRPSPLSLYNNPQQSSPSSSFSPKTGSPTSAVSRDSTTATDIATSPRAAAAAAAAAATLGFASPLAPRSTLPLHSGPLVSMSSATSTSGSSYGSNNSSPTTMTAPCSSLCHSKSGLANSQQQQQQHHPNCLHKQSTASQQIHHPACQHHTNFPEDDLMAHGPKPGRVTKNVRRFGFPQFRPQLDESDPGTFDPSRRDKSSTSMKTTSTSTTGYGMRRGHHHEDDDDDLGVYALEPPKKRQRSTATMLLDAAFETVIFTGAVALSAYQLITGKGKVPDHSKQPSITSGDDDGLQAENVKTLEDDPMEEKLSLDLDSETFTTTNNSAPPRIRPFSTSGTLLTRASSTSTSSRPSSFHYKSQQQKRASFRQSRQSFSTSSSPAYNHIPHQHTGHFRSPSMPVRPNTGTEDTDEAFLRMEAQLNSLIAEGKRALSSRIEVWDEE